MTTRAKFYCQRTTQYTTNSEVHLTAVTGKGNEQLNPENVNFTKATPAGQITMTIDNPDAACQFAPGKYYYVDFTEAAQ